MRPLALRHRFPRGMRGSKVKVTASPTNVVTRRVWDDRVPRVG